MKALPFTAAAFTEADFSPVDAEKVVAGTPAQAFRVLYSSKDEAFTAGIYACTPGKWRVSYTEDEFCTLLSGTVRLADAQGGVQEFTAPESFLIPSGFSGTWEAVTAVQKSFLIYEKTG